MATSGMTLAAVRVRAPREPCATSHDTQSAPHRPTRMGDLTVVASSPAARTDILMPTGVRGQGMGATPPRHGVTTMVPAAVVRGQLGRTTGGTIHANSPPEEDATLAVARAPQRIPGIDRDREAHLQCDYQPLSSLPSEFRLLEGIVRRPQREGGMRGCHRLDSGMGRHPDHHKQRGGIRGLPVQRLITSGGGKPACRPIGRLRRRIPMPS
mmetsp:Transcript_58735/g.108379  ORF Transcript_58735/g.108379 Transcript_58735/m.108379 type:complete len:211 (-) Transcript_58735:1005-1637(-)